MESNEGKSRGKAGRRIGWLVFAIALAGFVYTAGWFWFAGRIDETAGRMIAQAEADGVAITCPDRTVRGYPFRFEVHCSALQVTNRDTALDAGAMRTAAQVYQPSKIVAELDSPVSLDSAGMPPIEAQWDLAQASALIANPLPERASIAIDGLAVAMGDIQSALQAARFEGHMRRVEGDLDLASRFEGVRVAPELANGRQLPAFGGEYDLRLDNGVALAVAGVPSLRGVSGTIRRAVLRLTVDEGVELTGDFGFDDAGLLNADLNLTVVDAAGLAQALQPAFPEYAGQIATLAATQEASASEGPPEFTVPVAIRDGKARLGFIPLGEVPPVN